VDLFCGLFCSYCGSCWLYSDIDERIVFCGHVEVLTIFKKIKTSIVVGQKSQQHSSRSSMNIQGRLLEFWPTVPNLLCISTAGSLDAFVVDCGSHGSSKAAAAGPTDSYNVVEAPTSLDRSRF
jgi:hypothetical protein